MINNIELISLADTKITFRLFTEPDKIDSLAEQMRKVGLNTFKIDSSFVEVTLSADNTFAFLEYLNQLELLEQTIFAAFKQNYNNILLDGAEKDVDSLKPFIDQVVQSASYKNANVEIKEAVRRLDSLLDSLMENFSCRLRNLREQNNATHLIATNIFSPQRDSDDFDKIKKNLVNFTKMLATFPIQATKLLYGITVLPLDTDVKISNLIDNVFADKLLSRTEKKQLFIELRAIYHCSRKSSEKLQLKNNLDQQPQMIVQMVHDAAIALILEAQETIKNQAVDAALAKLAQVHELVLQAAVEKAITETRKEMEEKIETSQPQNRVYRSNSSFF